MSPKNQFGEQYLSETERNKRPFNALRAAVERYIEIRQGWIERGSSSIGLRGTFSGGRLFFNRAKTEANLAAMRRVMEIIDDNHLRAERKKTEIDRLKDNMTQGGQGRALLEIFCSTAIGEESAYIPSQVALEESIYVVQDTVYRRRETLGKGAYGKARRFESPESGKNVVVKDLHDPNTSTRQLEKETEIFRLVYERLGRPYFGGETHSRVLQAPSGASAAAKVVLPQVPGGSMFSYCKDYPGYDEDAMFLAVFNFLWALHNELKICHNDCHPGNIMIIDRLLNVFFIDYGLASQLRDLRGPESSRKSQFRDAMRADVALCVTNILETRKYSRRKGDVSLADIKAKYNLGRWEGPAFHRGQPMDRYIPQKVNGFAAIYGIPGRLKA